MFTLLVKDLYSSYKDLPLVIYQIQTKFRDEARPRAGLLRGREFVMKDSYSFDLNDEGLEEQLPAAPSRLQRTFDRLGLPYVIVSAMCGAMGGSASEEFLAPMDVGEDTFVRCTNCDYAANTEAVRVAVPPPSRTTAARGAVADTPDTPTIQTLVDLINGRDDLRRPDRDWTAADTLKNVIVKLRHPDGTHRTARDRRARRPRGRPEAARGPGPPRRGRTVRRRGFRRATQHLVKGYIGPGALGADKPAGIRYLVDPRIVDGTQWVTGADEAGRHVLYLTAGRDFVADGTIEAAEVTDGDACPRVRIARSRSPAASRSATSSSSVASTPRRSASTCWTRTASSRWSPWARTASACHAPWPRSPR